MFEQFKKLMESTSKRTHEQTGKIVDFLKQISHFNQIQQNLGSQYLINIIPLLKPFILRESFTLINQNDQYVLVEGQLTVKQCQGQGGRPFVAGKLIDLRENPQICYVAENDCNLIRITRNAVSNLLQKKISESQKQRSRKYKTFQRLLENNQNRNKLEIIKNSPFISYLGNYDIYELSIGCHLKEYSQNQGTHKVNDKVEMIGYIVSGKMKLSFNGKGQRHRKESSVTWFLNEKDWIGLEQFLWENNFQSSGQVYSIGAIILWIPVELFASKFNVRTNHEAITRLMNLIKTKRALFDRSFNIRLTKEQKIDEENSYKQPSAELISKMEALQGLKTVKNKHIYRSINKSQQKKAQQEDIEIPEFILHKMKNLQEEPIMLPKLQEKTIFFPDDYVGIPIMATQKKEKDRLQSIIKPRNLQSYTTIQLNPQNLYKTIYSKIAYRFPKKTQVGQTPRSPRHEHSLLHFNSSIYNNFRVNKNKRNQSQSFKKNTTLQIMNTNHQ